MTSSYNKNNRIPGSSYIYNSEGPVALSLELIILRELVLSWIRRRNALTKKALDCKTVRIFAYSIKYARAVKQKVWNEAEDRERDWGETLKIFLSPHTPYGRVRLARCACARLLSHALPISLLILRKKPTVLQSKKA